MIFSPAVWRIARKDGLEVLRDRRTLFINLILPVLLYPLLTLFMVQVLQLAQATKRDPPRIATIGVPAPALRLLTQAPPTPTTKKGLATPAENAPELVTLPKDALATLTQLATSLSQGEPSAADRKAALTLLRQHHLVTALIVLDPTATPVQVLRLNDDAHPRLDESTTCTDRALDAWRKEQINTTLAAAHLAPDVLIPIKTTTLTLAPVAEAVRTRIAGMIPLLLVILATSGAFFPAMDLIAGERERGTLETLLSLPLRRRDVFLGKLLVCCAAALVAVILNLLSLTTTVALMGSQLAKAGAALDLSGMAGVGGGTLLLCVVMLLPLTITLAALALALAGVANSVKEANNTLAPLILVVTVAGGVAAMPRIEPNLALDLIPITGVVLALKEALQAPTLPWLHLGLAGLSSLAVAAIVVSWATRLLESERFRYPGLVRAGWGRWRKWGLTPPVPGGLEALGIYAIAVGGMTLGAGLLANAPAVAIVAVPLLAFVAMPALIHAWAGAYPLRSVHLGPPAPRHLLGGLFLIVPAIALSISIGGLQSLLVDPKLIEHGGDGVMEIIGKVQAAGGLALVLVCVGLLPGLCEEILCRGTLLAGLRQGLGPVGGVLISGFLFAVLHLSPWRFAPQCALGIGLAILCLRCGSIWPGVIIHAGHNSLLVLAEMASTGQIAVLQPVVTAARHMPDWVWWLTIPPVLASLASAGWRLTRR